MMTVVNVGEIYCATSFGEFAAMKRKVQCWFKDLTLKCGGVIFVQGSGDKVETLVNDIF